MTCLAVTRGGHGDVWLFDTRTVAYLHPLVQYGDALVQGPTDIVHQYNRLDWNTLRSVAGLPPAQLPDTPREWRMFAEFQADQVYDALVKRASRPPLDPQQICDMVSRDRRLGTMAKKKDTAPADVTAAQAPAVAGAAATAGSLPTTRGPKGVPLDAVIHMGKNKEDKHYGPDNNPKKPGSKTHGRFAKYSHGMTVQQALDVGIPTADLVYDREHGFISFVGGTAGAAPSAPAPQAAAPAVDAETAAEQEAELEEALEEEQG